MIEYKIPCLEKSGVPLYFRFLKAWSVIFRGKGTFKIFKIFMSLGLLNRVAKFKYFKTGIYVPLDILDTIDTDDFGLYQGLREVNFANLTYQYLTDYVLIDCGCAFGQVSMRMASVCKNLKSIVAIDPNFSHCEITRKNLSLTGVDYTIVNAAVSDFTGTGALVFLGVNTTRTPLILKKAIAATLRSSA